MNLKQYSVAVTTTGSAGSATGSGSIHVTHPGFVEWIRLDFHASAPATTDTTIAHGATPPGGNILVVTDSATDATIYPAAALVNTANSAITNSHRRIPVMGTVSVSVAQCDALTAAVTVYMGVSDE